LEAAPFRSSMGGLVLPNIGEYAYPAAGDPRNLGFIAHRGRPWAGALTAG